MHNIKTNFGRLYYICKQFFECETDRNGNFKRYPRMPVLSDVQVVALSCMMEALAIDSENFSWSKLKTDTKKEMEKAARDMDFMEAAHLRDEMFAMQKRLEGMKV